MVNVIKSNFINESNDLIQRLPSASFIAIDEEMTGIVIPNGPRPPKDQTPSERYDMLKAVPEKYSIIQLGVALFHENPDFHNNRIDGNNVPEFVARKYNFWMFPPADLKITREVVLNPSSIAFLNQHNMNFDVWTKYGVPFVTGDDAELLIAKFQQKELEKKENKEKNRSLAFRPGKRKVVLRRTEDIYFHARSMASLREWLDSAQPIRRPGAIGDVQEGLSFLLPPANSFLRRALYETIAMEYPSLILENAGTNHPNQIRVLRLDPAEQAAREERLMRQSWEELIVNQIGAWRVFMALSLACHGFEIPRDSITFAPNVGSIDWARGFENMGNLQHTGRRVPIVVHNGYMDLMFLLTHFHSHKLPSNFANVKALIHSYFPTIYDTKLLVTECAPDSWNDTSTNLENLFLKIMGENNDMGRLVEMALERNEDGDITASTDNAHCASYDAFMTGCVYAHFCNLISRHQGFPQMIDLAVGEQRRVGSMAHLLQDEHDERVKSIFGRNKLYLMQSIYSIDLETEGEDPLCSGMIPESIFRISNFDPSVTTRTIIQCLSDVVDSRYQTVNFELYWCNDTTFLVAASRKPSPRTMAEVMVLREHGSLILEALKRRFPSENIVSWLDYTTRQSVGVEQEERHWSYSFGGFMQKLFGWRRAQEESTATPPKHDFEINDTEPNQPQAKRMRIR